MVCNRDFTKQEVMLGFLGVHGVTFCQIRASWFLEDSKIASKRQRILLNNEHSRAVAIAQWWSANLVYTASYPQQLINLTPWHRICNHIMQERGQEHHKFKVILEAWVQFQLHETAKKKLEINATHMQMRKINSEGRCTWHRLYNQNWWWFLSLLFVFLSNTHIPLYDVIGEWCFYVLHF